MPTQVLIADDQSADLEPIVQWLRQQNYEVALASRFEQVILMTDQRQPDLILLSTTLANTTSIEMCQRWRQNPNTAQIPIILLSNSIASEARAECIHAGANDFVTRPLKLNDVQLRVNTLLNPETVALGETYRLLEETCQASLLLLPCNVAWLLTVEPTPEGAVLLSRMIVTDRGNGNSAGEVFLRLVAEGKPENPRFPILPRLHPLADALLKSSPLVNVNISQIQSAIGGVPLYRALSQLRMNYAHFLPLAVRGRTLGLLVLASKEIHDMSVPQGQKLIMAVTNQASTVVENARLISDQSTRQEQVRAEQSFRKMILDTMGDALIVIDSNAVIRYVNNRMLRMSGYSREELYNQSVGVVFHPEGREHLVNGLKRASRSTVNFSQRLITRNGSIIPVLMSRATGLTGGATTSGDLNTVLVLSDISEQKKREAELERQSERLRLLNRAVQTTTSALSIEDVITVLMHSAMEITQCTSICLYMRNEVDTEVYPVVAAVGVMANSLRQITAEPGVGLIGQILLDRRPRLLLNVKPDGSPDERPGSCVIAVPLNIMDQAIGVLEAINKVDGQFVQEDLEVLENLASSASIAIENARLFTQTQRRVNELSTLLEASSAVSSTLDINKVLELIARRLIESVNAVRCQILSWERRSRMLLMMAEVCNAYWEWGRGPTRPALIMPLLISTLLQEAAPPAIYRQDDDYADLPNSNDANSSNGNNGNGNSQNGNPKVDPRMQGHLQQIGMRQALLIPLRMGQQVVGLIELYSTQEYDTFSTKTYSAVEEALGRWREMLKKRSTVDWVDHDNLTDLYQRVMRASNASYCIISAWDRTQKSLYAVREIGFALHNEKLIEPFSSEPYKAMTYSLQEGAPVTVYPDTSEGDDVERSLMSSLGVSSGLIVPLLVRGEAVGLVKVMDSVPGRHFDIAEISLSQAIANVLANALENAQLYQSLERRADALQAAYDELRLSDKVKDALIQNLSHELQTPLHQVVMELELVSDGAFGPVNVEQNEYVRSALNRINKLGELIRDMVSVGRLDTQNIEFASVALDDVIKGAVRRQQAQADKFALQIIAEMPSKLPPVRANAEQLSIVLDQLLDNAIKFSPRAERKMDRIEILVENVDGAMLHVTVKDYGIGIPKAEFDKIFHRGYQVDGSMTRRFGGTGIGLSLARQIIEAHGGKIWVESTVENGSMFRFTLPKASVNLTNGKH